MKRILAIGIIAALVMTSIPCLAGSQKLPGPDQTIVLTSDKKFKVKFDDGSSFKAYGRDVKFHSQTVGVRQTDGRMFYYDRSRVSGIYHGSHWAMGMGIGAGAGAGLGTLIGYLGSRGSCENAGDPDDCQAMKAIPWLVGIGLGTLMGAGIGAGIGAAIPKKAKFTVAPTVMSAPGRPIAGAGIGFSGRF